jgi:mono/diheme cytochrome c family protein
MDSATFRTFARGAVAAAVVAWGAALVLAGEQAPDPAASVFTVKQATAGKAVYAKHCASCHIADLSGNSEIPALAGPAFREMWDTRSTKELFDYMSAAMPYGAPSLTVDEYSAIVAYVLQFNGAVAGEEELTGATAVTISSVMRR